MESSLKITSYSLKLYYKVINVKICAKLELEIKIHFQAFEFYFSLSNLNQNLEPSFSFIY